MGFQMLLIYACQEPQQIQPCGPQWEMPDVLLQQHLEGCKILISQAKQQGKQPFKRQWFFTQLENRISLPPPPRLHFLLSIKLLPRGRKGRRARGKTTLPKFNFSSPSHFKERKDFVQSLIPRRLSAEERPNCIPIKLYRASPVLGCQQDPSVLIYRPRKHSTIMVINNNRIQYMTT